MSGDVKIKVWELWLIVLWYFALGVGAALVCR